ncbi:hypothetical protein SDRG_15419, partial [Saprolegnia diclina VS20]
LQWQNRWQPGITESITLENAIGLQQLVTVKNLAQGAGPWTTNLLFWIPLNDLTLAKYMNRSLVRGTSRFFDANLSASLPAKDLEVVQGVTAVAGQFFNQSALFRRLIGPFQTVDVLYQKAPSALTAAYEKGRQILLSVIAPTTTFALTPHAWRSVALYGGGNLMCPKMPRTSFVQQSFDFFDDCAKPKALTATLSPLTLVLARAATKNHSIAEICAVASPAAACVAAITAADQLLESFALDWNTSVANEIGLNIGLMQYATAANGSWVVLKQPLLEPSFAFF